MNLVKIGDEYINLEAVVRITKASWSGLTLRPIPTAILHLSEGTTYEVMQSEFEQILEYSGNIEIPEFTNLNRPTKQES